MKKVWSLLLCLLVVFSSIPTSSGVAFAVTATYSDVLSDLQADENFNKADYIINQTDYSLNLIQLAESNDKLLLVYVYQPSAGRNDVLVKKIRMSVDDGQTYADYDLTLLSRNGVFFKYKVDNYVADYTSTVKRSYNVVQLMRVADETLGDKVLDENNNKISMIPYTVGYTFSAETREDGLYYGKYKSNYSVVTEKYCGQLLFDSPSNKLTQYVYGVEYGMLHFIAFNGVGVINEDGTSRKAEIDELQEADVEYTLVHHEKSYMVHAFGIADGGNYDKDISEERIPKTLKAENKNSYKNGIFAHKYSWHEIMTMNDFLSDCVESDSLFFSSKLTAAAREEFADMQYVLILGVTEIQHTNVIIENGMGYHETDSRYYVNDETILRLQIVSDGKVYNLGTVDNYQTGDGDPDNEEKYGINEKYWKDWFRNIWEDIQEWIKIIAIIIGLILLGVFLLFFGAPIAKLIKAIFKILFAPFRWLFGSKKRR